MNKARRLLPLLAALPMLLMIFACEDGKSYSDLLREEEKATNWYMAQQTIELNVPEDSVLQYGPDAPYYKLDPDGYIYLQVINPGDTTKPVKGDLVYFRFKRKNLKNWYEGNETAFEGNDDLGSALGATSFVYDEMTIVSSSKYGEGIQWPLKF